MAAIDLNVDIGEGGANDDALLPYATSINIACGWHAGDPVTMHRLAAAALARYRHRCSSELPRSRAFRPASPRN